MEDANLLDAVRSLGKNREQIALTLRRSPLAPEGRELSPSALGMWFTRGHVPHMWRSAALERLGKLAMSDEGLEHD